MTPEQAVGELRAVAATMVETAKLGSDSKVTAPIQAYEDAAEHIAKSWSGSNLGYHATVYYAGFAEPPAGAVWDVEWGGLQVHFQGSRGDWRQYERAAVREAIDAAAGGADLNEAEAMAAEAKAAFDTAHGAVLSILTALNQVDDNYMRTLKAKAEGLEIPSWRQIARANLVPTTVMSRDMQAVNGGQRSSVHEDVIARVLAVRVTFVTCTQLSNLAEQAASHIERAGIGARPGAANPGGRVFIGHGRSPIWRDLKDFIEDHLHLPSDEFNRVPVAGVTNVARLSEMLDAAGIAFLVLTAEDELVDGSIVARENVVHEAGLFQGRLSFPRAIIMLEDGCGEFSNIHGLGQVRFPAGNIAAAFEQVRQVLVREGFLE